MSLDMPVPYSPIGGTVEFMHAVAAAVAVRHAQRDYFSTVATEFTNAPEPPSLADAREQGLRDVRELNAELAAAVAGVGGLAARPHAATLGRRLIERGEHVDREAKLYHPSPGFVLMLGQMVRSGLDDLDGFDAMFAEDEL